MWQNDPKYILILVIRHNSFNIALEFHSIER